MSCFGCKFLKWKWLRSTYYCEKTKTYAVRGDYRGHYLGSSVEPEDCIENIKEV